MALRRPTLEGIRAHIEGILGGISSGACVTPQSVKPLRIQCSLLKTTVRKLSIDCTVCCLHMTHKHSLVLSFDVSNG